MQLSGNKNTSWSLFLCNSLYLWCSSSRAVREPGCPSISKGVTTVSLPQDQEDGEHVEGGEGQPDAPLLQRQAALCSRPLQEVAAGEKSSG